MRPAASAPTALLCASAGQAQPPPPIPDMHLHATPVSEWEDVGLPVAACAPFEERQAWDPVQQSCEDFFTRVSGEKGVRRSGMVGGDG
jgi:hypothetical protein